MDYEFPEKTPKPIKEILNETLSHVHSFLKENLIGIYLCGSLAMGGYNPKSSDIDLILVVNKTLAKEQRKKIIDYLKKVSSKDNRIELSIVTEEAVQNPRYPIMVDLDFGFWGEALENKKEKEILSNLYTARRRGFCIWGKPMSRVFSRIPAQYHLRSVIEDLESRRKYLRENADQVGYDVVVFWVLGSCRILAFIREDIVLSKLEGGRWGLANLPEEYHSVIKQAILRYQGKKRTQIWNYEKLEAFADYMTKTIHKEWNVN